MLDIWLQLVAVSVSEAVHQHIVILNIECGRSIVLSFGILDLDRVIIRNDEIIELSKPIFYLFFSLVFVLYLVITIDVVALESYPVTDKVAVFSLYATLVLPCSKCTGNKYLIT